MLVVLPDSTSGLFNVYLYMDLFICPNHTVLNIIKKLIIE